MNKKKIVSVLLSVVILCSTFGVPIFAEDSAETEVVSQAAENLETEKIPEDYGAAVKVGESRYKITEDGLLLTRNGETSLFDSGKITYVIEQDGVLYWSKLDGNNSLVYRQNLSGGEKTVLAGVFVPVEAFDVVEDELYYLYSGEITKLNVMTDEETSLGMFDCDGFYLDGEDNICAVKNHQNENLSNAEDLTNAMIQRPKCKVCPYCQKTFSYYLEDFMFGLKCPYCGRATTRIGRFIDTILRKHK